MSAMRSQLKDRTQALGDVSLSLNPKPVFRTAGIHAPNADDVQWFLSTIKRSFHKDDLEQVTILSYPDTSPVVAVLVSENQYPPVQIARHPDGSFVIVDGEIFSGMHLPRDNDEDRDNPAALLLRSYKRIGTKLFENLDAGAVLTLWDAETETLTICRDPVGNVPGFYLEHDGKFIWGSKITTLVGLGLYHEINRPALDSFMARGFIPAPLSFVDGIHRLSPGQLISACRGGPIKTASYFIGSPRQSGAPQEVADPGDLESLLCASLERRINRDRDTGLLLSGGVDSQLLLAVMARKLDVIPDTFTFHYHDYAGDYNESGAAKECAEYFGAPHHILEVSPSDIIDNLDRMILGYGEPFSYGLHSFLMQDVRRTGVMDLLCGTGADGYYLSNRERRALVAARIPSLLRGFLQLSSSVAGRLGSIIESSGFEDKAQTVFRVSDALRWARHSADTNLPGIFDDGITPLRLRRDLWQEKDWHDSAIEIQEENAIAACSEISQSDPGAIFRLLALRYFGAEMMQNWNHWAARENGVSIRAPYYDRGLLNLIYQLPMSAKGKPELRALASGLMPNSMAYRKKLPQSLPIGHWLRGPLKDFISDHLSRSRIEASGLFDPAVVERFLAQHRSGAVNHRWRLWNILSVLTWQRVVQSGRFAANSS